MRVIFWYDEVIVRFDRDFIFSTGNLENSVYGWYSTGKKWCYRVRTRLMNKHDWDIEAKTIFYIDQHRENSGSGRLQKDSIVG